MKRSLFLLLVTVVCFAPVAHISAHEVYVLDHEAIEHSLAAESPNPFNAYHGNEYEFYFWAFVSLLVFSTVLLASMFRLFEKRASPYLLFLQRFAHPLVRLTVGVTLVVFGLYGVLYGPELPLPLLFGSVADFLQILLMVLGAAVIMGLYTRIAALIAITIYLYAAGTAGWYVVSYANHLGAYFLLLILGGGEWSLRERLPAFAHSFISTLRPLAFPFLRVLFGGSIMFAAVYAKFLHSELALQVVAEYDLTRFFQFEPLFIILGAFIIEFLAGLMLFLGIAVRWTVLFLAFWLTLGQIFTTEMWWVHLILFGAGIAIFLHGYDKYTLEWALMRRMNKDAPAPIL